MDLTVEDEWNFALLAFLVFFAFGVLASYLQNHSKKGRRGRGWLAGMGAGYGGGGGSSGGGGGFSGGGGSFGGGGASGRW
jgi:uncharacterized protein